MKLKKVINQVEKIISESSILLTILKNKDVYDCDFHEILRHVIMYEGGYVNNPNDPGGVTNLGITQDTYNKYREEAGLFKKSVEDMSRDEMKNIYYYMYWIPSRCDRIESTFVSFLVFDTGVNCGISQSIKTLQRTINTVMFSVNNDVTGNIKVDGLFGPKTLLALDKCIKKCTKKMFINSFSQHRLDYYSLIAKKIPS